MKENLLVFKLLCHMGVLVMFFLLRIIYTYIYTMRERRALYIYVLVYTYITVNSETCVYLA